jgi:hypothetical protein
MNAANAFMQDQPFCEGNTAVTLDGEYTSMSLHGNVIAFKDSDSAVEPPFMVITNCGWFTNVTKERLNALPGVSIKGGIGGWLLNGEEWNGETRTINADGHHEACKIHNRIRINFIERVELIVEELVNQEELQIDYEYWSAHSLAEAVASFQMQFDGWRDLKHRVLVEAIAQMEITGRNDE